MDDTERGSRNLDKPPLSVSIARTLSQAIITGELPAGTALPSEKALCERFGVGRSTVREALRVLQAQGLLTGGDRVTTRGPVVDGAGAQNTAATALGNVLQLGLVPLHDLVTLRLLIEKSAAETAAVVNDSAALGRTQAALDAMRRAGNDLERFHEADVEFHTALIAASKNAAFGLVMAALRRTMTHHLREALHRRPDRADVVAQLIDEHTAVFTAVLAGDAERAGALMVAHIAGFYEAP